MADAVNERGRGGFGWDFGHPSTHFTVHGSIGPSVTMRSFVLVRSVTIRFELALAEIRASFHVGVAVPPYAATKVISSVQALYGRVALPSHRPFPAATI